MVKKDTIENDVSPVGTSTQTEIKNMTKTLKISKDVSGAMWIFNPVGSSYKDPDTKQIVVRTEASLQYAKAGIPQKFGLSRVDLENIKVLLSSKEFPAILAALPETATFEPNTY